MNNDSNVLMANNNFTTPASIFSYSNSKSSFSVKCTEITINLAGKGANEIELYLLKDTKTIVVNVGGKEQTFFLSKCSNLDEIKASYIDGILKIVVPNKFEKIPILLKAIM